MNDSTDYYDDDYDETPADLAKAADGAALLIAAMEAGNCATTADLIDEMGRRGIRNFNTFIAQCEAEKTPK